MQLLIKGKNVDVTDAMRAHVEKKLGRLDRYLDSISQTEVEISTEKTRAASDRYAVQVTMLTNGTILRGEERGQDIVMAVDSVVDVLQRRLAHYKGKLYRRSRGTVPKEAMAEAVAIAEAETTEPEEADEPHEARIVRIKRVAMKPMSVAEAADQMELLGHDFFLFYNSNTDKTAVIYRRHSGDFGLIEAEMGA
jgi:putative sigma-54 modulation protein